MQTNLYENSMFTTPSARATLVADGKLCTELFFINFVSFLGLYALNDSRGYMKAYENTEKKLKIAEIADDNHDASLVIKLAVDAGVLAEAKTIQVTRLLSLIKQRTLRSKDIDSVRVRELLETTQLHLKPMGALVKDVVRQFMDGTIDIKEYARQMYDVAKNNAWRPYTLELRTLILKGQYTDYFTVMKRGGTVQPPANQVAAPRVTTAPSPSATRAQAVPSSSISTKPAAPLKMSADDIDEALADIAIRNAGATTTTGALDSGPMLDRIAMLQANGIPGKGVPTVDDIGAGIDRLPFSVFSNGFHSTPTPRAFGDRLELRALQSTAASGKWSKISLMSSLTATPSASGQRAELLLDALKKYPLPSSEEEMKEFRYLISYNRSFQVNTAYVIDNLKPLIKPLDATNHNIHLLCAMPPSSSGFSIAHVVETGDLSPKALAWVRKYGAAPGNVYPVITSNGMTTAAWGKLDISGKVLWAANNFTLEGGRKIATFSRNTRLIDPWTAPEPTRRKVAEILSSKWNDAALFASFTLLPTATGMWLARIAVTAGVIKMLEAKAPISCPDQFKQHFCAMSNNGTPSELNELHNLMGQMPYDTAIDVDKFNTFAGTMYSESNARPIKEGMIDLTMRSVRTSRVRWLMWGRNMSRTAPLGVSNWETGVATLDSNSVSPEVEAFVNTYGETGAVKLRFLKPLNTAAAAARFCVIYCTTGAGADDSQSISTVVYDEISKMTEDEWIAVAKTIQAEGKHPEMFKTFHENPSYVIKMDGGYRSNAPAYLRSGLSRYFINEFPRVGNDHRDEWVSLPQLRAPLTADKAALVAPYVNKYDKDVPSDHANEILRSGLVARSISKDTTPLFAALARAAALASLSEFADNCDMAMTEDYREFAPILAAAMQADTVVPVDLHAAYRWAWPVTPAQIEGFLKSTYDAVSAKPDSYQAAAYTPLLFDTAEIFEDDAHKTFARDVLFAMKKMDLYAGSVDLLTTPWFGVIDMALVKPPITKPTISFSSAWTSLNVARQLALSPHGDGIAKEILLNTVDMLSKGGLKGITGYQADGLVKQLEENDIPATEIRKVLEAVFTQYNERKAKPIDYAELADALKNNSTEYITPADMAIVVKRLASSTSKACEAAISSLAYTSKSNGKVSADFIAAVRLAGVERATLNRLNKSDVVGQVVAHINGDVNGIPINVTPSRMTDFLEYNDVDVSSLASTSVVTRLEDLGGVNTRLTTAIPPLYLVEDKSPAAIKDAIRSLHNANRYNHNPALGLEVKRKFAVTLPGQRDKFDAWLASNPSSKVMTLYHGTGTWAAQFLLRYGFRIIRSTDPGVTGRMLGDGIYFADNINKSMLYMSNAGYIRQDGQEGYVFKCKVALGRSPRDHREGSASRSGLVSNEWAIFSTDQIVIEEAYMGISRQRSHVRSLLNEDTGDAYIPHVSSFMFMDGMIPITADILVDFEKLPDFGGHVTIETSAKGPIVNIRHDKTIETIGRCYRYGEELQSKSAAKELTQFLNLLHNRY